MLGDDYVVLQNENPSENVKQEIDRSYAQDTTGACRSMLGRTFNC
jgi:hypothetical protein